jgi:hypothetical protein
MIVPRSLFQLDINLMLVSFDEQRVPSLQRPYLCCRPTLSINKLCQVIFLLTYILFSNNDTSFILSAPDVSV